MCIPADKQGLEPITVVPWRPASCAKSSALLPTSELMQNCDRGELRFGYSDTSFDTYSLVSICRVAYQEGRSRVVAMHDSLYLALEVSCGLVRYRSEFTTPSLCRILDSTIIFH